MSGAERRLQVRVVYVRPGLQFQRTVELPQGAKVGDALAASGVLIAVPELNATSFEVGIFSRPCSTDEKLTDGDRVEIYRPLAIDPKAARRLRAAVRRRRR